MEFSQIVGIVLSLLSGLGLFLFGMNLMGDGLEKAAGDKMSGIIEKMTGNLFKGVLAGIVVTGLIQSSSATTVMVIGFINAGIMKLGQAVGVIMGANIGTTVTAQLLSLSEISGSAWYLAILKPTNFAPVLIGVGVFFIIFSKKKIINHIGDILAGFGMIFIGMSMMEGAVDPLKELPWFQTMFESLTNPVLGVLAGALVTAIIQSSSASIGILQAASATGNVTFSSAAPIILGQNIGTCITAILSAVGANKNAKRAAVIHLAFNIIGTVVFLVILYSVKNMIPFWDDVANKNTIANFHLVFNVVNTLLLLPFTKLLVKLANFIVKDIEVVEEKLKPLDERFLANPPVAVQQAKKETLHMACFAYNNFVLSKKAVVDMDFSVEEILLANEEVIDEYETDIWRYLMKIVDADLSTSDSKLTSSLFHVLIDVERIGDRCLNMYEVAKEMHSAGIVLSDKARMAMSNMMDAVGEIFNLSISCYDKLDEEAAHKITTYEDVIDEMRQRLRIEHMTRMSNNECNFEAGVVYLDLASNLERISDHCTNIAKSVEQLISKNAKFDPHKDSNSFQKENPQEYAVLYKEFDEKYRIGAK
ncbi:MAG: Na/Pi cotransporter family protein [Clostridia bacterium]|nr:Na/Pi cotransporter family protein [Clostridia bacterium]